MPTPSDAFLSPEVRQAFHRVSLGGAFVALLVLLLFAGVQESLRPAPGGAPLTFTVHMARLIEPLSVLAGCGAVGCVLAAHYWGWVRERNLRRVERVLRAEILASDEPLQLLQLGSFRAPGDGYVPGYLAVTARRLIQVRSTERGVQVALVAERQDPAFRLRRVARRVSVRPLLGSVARWLGSDQALRIDARHGDTSFDQTSTVFLSVTPALEQLCLHLQLAGHPVEFQNEADLTKTPRATLAWGPEVRLRGTKARRRLQLLGFSLICLGVYVVYLLLSRGL